MVGGRGENLEWKEWRVDVIKIIACKKFSIKERNLNMQFLKKKGNSEGICKSSIRWKKERRKLVTWKRLTQGLLT